MSNERREGEGRDEGEEVRRKGGERKKEDRKRGGEKLDKGGQTVKGQKERRENESTNRKNREGRTEGEMDEGRERWRNDGQGGEEEK